MIDGLRPKMTVLEPTSQRNAKAATAATSPSTGGILEQLSIDPAPVQVSTPRYSGKQSDNGYYNKNFENRIALSVGCVRKKICTRIPVDGEWPCAHCLFYIFC